MSEDDKTHQRAPAPASDTSSSTLQIVPGVVLKGTYRIDSELGSGGMGTVFLATHVGLEKRMAVKVLSPRAISSPESLARFEREAKVAGKVSHPAMAHVIDFGVEQGTPYIVMEYVDGMELAELIERQGLMPPRQAVAVMRQLVSLLHAAHSLGIVHRDLKPSNIKVLQAGPDGQLFVKVLDFGIAKVVGDISGKLTSTGTMVGTPAYMAPEQISGQPIDGRTDLYAVGLIFHELLGGVRAYQGDTIARILHAQLNEPPPPLTLPLPDVVRQTLQKFYEKRPEDRFQDAAEADRALMACEEALRSFSAPPVGAPAAPRAGAASSPPMTPEGLSATMRRPEPEAPVARPSTAVSAPVRPSTDRESLPVPVPATAARPPAPATSVLPKRTQPVKSSFLGRGCLVAVLAVGFMGCLGLGGAVLWAMENGGQLAEGEAGLPMNPSPPGAAPRPPKPIPVAAPEEPAPAAPTVVEPQEQVPVREQRTRPLDGPGCYVSEVIFGSSREDDGQDGPWEFDTIISRDTIDCDSVRPRELSPEEKKLADAWSYEEEVLEVKTLSSPEPDPEEPDTRRQRLRVFTRVSEGAP